MASWEAAANAMSFSFYPGELSAMGATTLGATGIKGPTVNPANYYAEPEMLDFEVGTYLPWCAADLRASLALYDYRYEDTPYFVPELTQDAMQVYQAPRTWRSALLVFIDTPPPPPPPPTVVNYYCGGFANLQRLSRGIGWVN